MDLAGRGGREPARAYRWVVLAAISLAMLGNYYLYDSVAPVADLLKSQLGFSDERIGLLYTVYSVGAFLVLLASGVVVDRVGTRAATMLFGVVTAVAGILTAVSPDFGVMLAGRFLLGVGAEPLIVAITTAIAKWFKGRELSFAFGVNLLIARLGSAAADNSPTWASALYRGWQPPLWLAAGIGLACVLGGLGYLALESAAERRFALGRPGSADKLVLADLVRFDRAYWYVVGLCFTFYSAIFPFRAFAIKFFMETRGMSREAGGFVNSILQWTAMLATPLFGYLVDRVGRRAFLMAAGSLLLLPVYLLTVYTGLSPYLTIAAMGIAFSLIPAVLWPSVAYIVEERRLGSALALMTLIQQVGMGGVAWLVGAANDAAGASGPNPQGYRPGMWIFTLLGLFGLVFSWLLWRLERRGGHGLETIRAS